MPEVACFLDVRLLILRLIHLKLALCSAHGKAKHYSKGGYVCSCKNCRAFDAVLCRAYHFNGDKKNRCLSAHEAASEIVVRLCYEAVAGYVSIADVYPKKWLVGRDVGHAKRLFILKDIAKRGFHWIV
jgi:hypothetical protein